MSVSSLFPNIRFHLRGSGTMLSTNISRFLRFRLHFLLLLGLIFLTFKDDSTHDCIFYTHIYYIVSIHISDAKISLFYGIVYLWRIKQYIITKMATITLSAEKDPMGAAISDYFNHHRADRLRVFSSQFEEDEIPVKELFRSIQSMPVLERTALQMATGRILDVGAGSGCHTLALQEMGKEVCAIDISPLSNEVMKQRGVKDSRLINLFDETFTETFDTVLMLMNGSGIIGTLNNMPAFFQQMKRILRPGGCILMDSSDLRYLFEEEDGSMLIDLAGDYYGEVDFQMQYKDVKGDTFDWLYIDFQTLSLYASECGFKAKLIKEGKHYDYLAKLSLA